MSYTPQDGFPYYFDLVRNERLNELFSSPALFDFLKSIGETKGAYRYATGKWSIKQVVGHITDHERIKITRAFHLSREDYVELWGYDQELLVKNARFDELTMQRLIDDLTNVRKASISFIDSLTQQQLQIRGQARQFEVSLEDFLKSIIGHERHHLKIIREKYLNKS